MERLAVWGNIIRRLLLVCRYDGFRGDGKFAKWRAALMAFVRKRKRAFSSGYSLAALIFLQLVPTRASPTPPAMQKTRWKFNSRETMHGGEEFIASLIPWNFSQWFIHKNFLSLFSLFLLFFLSSVRRDSLFLPDLEIFIRRYIMLFYARTILKLFL